MTTSDLETAAVNTSSMASSSVDAASDAVSPMVSSSSYVPIGVVVDPAGSIPIANDKEEDNGKEEGCSKDEEEEDPMEKSNKEAAASVARSDWQAKQQTMFVSSSQELNPRPKELISVTLVPGESPAQTFDKNLEAVSFNNSATNIIATPTAPTSSFSSRNSTVKNTSRIHTEDNDVLLLLGAVSVTGDLSNSNHNNDASTTHNNSTANNMDGSSSTLPSIRQLRPVHRDSYLLQQHPAAAVSFGSSQEGGNNAAGEEDLEHQQPQQQHTAPSNTNGNIHTYGDEVLLLEATLVVDDDDDDDRYNHNTAAVAPTTNPGHHQIVHDDEQHERAMTSAKLVEAEELFCGFARNQLFYLGACLVFLLAAVAVAIALAVSNNNGGENDSDKSSEAAALAVTMAPTPTLRPTLEMIRDRDLVRCGIWKESLNFFNWADTYESEEDQVDFVLCRAYAAAILGDASKHKIVLTAGGDNLQQLANRNYDMLLSHTETGMQSDVWDSNLDINTGFTFSVPYVYTDLVYGGLPEYVACADDNMNARGNCSGIRICTQDNTAYFDSIAKEIPERYLIKRKDTLDIVLGFVEGICNVVPSENSGIMEWGLELLGYRGEYIRGIQPFQKDVATVATRDDDPEFSDFVNIIILGFFAAEQAGITKETADEMGNTSVLGDNLVQAVRAVGSYNDVYEQGISPFMKRRDWNYINNGTTGLLYTLQLGTVRHVGPGPVKGGTLESIWERQDRTLHCGIRMNRTGFASLDSNGHLVGLDVDFCRALAASILEGEAQSIIFVSIIDEADGYQKLQAGKVNVLAGFEWNVVNDYREPTTGEGYAFSQPYFYRPIGDQVQNMTTSSIMESENRCLVVRQDDLQFSSFSFWVVAATVYADELGITQNNANEMPDISIFGEDYLKMFRDAIFFVGSYSEIYERNLGELLPERGRNAINGIKVPGPQIYVPPGFF